MPLKLLLASGPALPLQLLAQPCPCVCQHETGAALAQGVTRGHVVCGRETCFPGLTPVLFLQQLVLASLCLSPNFHNPANSPVQRRLRLTMEGGTEAHTVVSSGSEHPHLASTPTYAALREGTNTTRPDLNGIYPRANESIVSKSRARDCQAFRFIGGREPRIGSPRAPCLGHTARQGHHPRRSRFNADQVSCLLHTLPTLLPGLNPTPGHSGSAPRHTSAHTDPGKTHRGSDGRCVASLPASAGFPSSGLIGDGMQGCA